MANERLYGHAHVGELVLQLGQGAQLTFVQAKALLNNFAHIIGG